MPAKSSWPDQDRRASFIAGSKAIAPILLGVIPFATIAGIASIEIGLSAAMAMGFTLIVFAGAAQLAAIQLIGSNASTMIIILTALIINLRFVMYSASLAPHFKNMSQKLRPLLAYLITDQAYAVSITRFTLEPGFHHKLWFYLGAAISMWATWLAGNLVGIFLGAQISNSWSLDFAVPLTFLAMIVPALKGRAPIAAAVVAAVVVVAAVSLPFNLGLIAAVLSGIAAGLAVEAAQPHRESQK